LLKKVPASGQVVPSIPPASAWSLSGTEPPPDVSFLGRPTLLWLLEHAGVPATDCVGGETSGGRVLVRVTRGGSLQAERLFDGTTAAVQWALDIESMLMNDGWTKTI
jgi:hypothetical protein